MSSFRHARLVPAAPESVCSARQDPVRLPRWWGPDGFTSTFQTFEFRQCGSWLFTLRGPDGAEYPNQSECLGVLPPVLVRRRQVNLPHFELSISLTPSGTGTLVSWIGVFENHEFAETNRRFLEAAPEQNLNRLALEVTTGLPRRS